MPDRLPFTTCDVFTKLSFSGNPLAIVEGAKDLSTTQMQTIAREFNLSETIFVQPPVDPSHTAKVRIFFPTAEIPFAGHPTIGCAIHLALQDAGDGDFDTLVTLEEEAGLVPVRVWRHGGQTRAELTAPVVPHAAREGQTPAREMLAAMLGLATEQIGFGTHHPGVYEGGPRFLYIPIKDLGALGKARAMEPHWSDAMRIAAVDSAYLYTPGDTADFRARMFSPTAGIPEDPATGSASAILAAQLLASGALRETTTRLVLHQGVEMQRPSEIVLTVVTEYRTLKEVRIAGTAVPISQGWISIP